MTNILPFSKFNIGGVNPLQYVFADEVKTFTLFSNLTATIVLKDGVSWKYLYATDGSVSLEGKEEITSSGIRYSYQFDMLIPKDQMTVETALLGMNDRGMILLAKNKNGTVRVFGIPENPMRKKGKLSWPDQAQEYNGTKLTLFGEFSSPAGYIPSLDSVIPFPVPEDFAAF